MALFLLITITIFITTGQKPPDNCIANWGQCGGKNWNKGTTCCLYTRYFCNKTDDYYSECVPYPLQPLSPAPPSSWCGKDGTTLNTSKLSDPNNVNSYEIGQIWSAATNGLNYGAPNYAKGGNQTCIEAVTIALGECGHPAQSPWKSIYDPVCNFAASGEGGIWQVTSQDDNDVKLAGCSNGTDVCCNARLAWAHAWNQGGAVVTPKDYCSQRNDCKQIYSDCHGTSGKPWNDPKIDEKYKNNAIIPNCSYVYNPWYPDNGTSLANITIDQEPCWFGPFSVAAGGVGKAFFAGFDGWGGYFQHYLNSKAGNCDDSPQCVSEKDTSCATNEEWKDFPYYIDLAIQACTVQ